MNEEAMRLIARKIVQDTFQRCADAADDLANKLESGELPDMTGVQAARVIAVLFTASAGTTH